MGLSSGDQNALVTAHLDLVGHIVAELSARYPRHVDRAELWNAGALGLVEASRRFDPEAGIPFARYAAIRIRGAIIDSTRTRDWASRSTRRGLREVAEATRILEEELSRTPTTAELARFLGVPVEEVETRRREADRSTLLHLDQPSEGEEIPLADRVWEDRVEILPEDALAQRELRGTLFEAIRHLPEIQRDVVTRYYLDGDLLQDIASGMSLTEARVSQIRSEALTAIRAYFQTQYDGVAAVDDSAPGKRARAAYLGRMVEHSTWRTRLDAAEAFRAAADA